MKKGSKYVFFAGLALLALVCSDIFWWIKVSANTAKSFEEVKRDFLLVFPGFLQNAILITFLNIAFSGIAGYLFMMSRSVGNLKFVATILAALCFLICLWQFFSLM